jgi:hypothetical protein
VARPYGARRILVNVVLFAVLLWLLGDATLRAWHPVTALLVGAGLVAAVLLAALPPPGAEAPPRR